MLTCGTLNSATVSPDAGSLKKIFDLIKSVNEIGLPGGPVNLVQADKVRDLATGNIVMTKLNTDPEEFKGRTLVIVDDIFDGGRTFVELAKVLKENSPDSTIILIVTFGIFCRGMQGLSGLIDHVFDTDGFNTKYWDFEENVVPDDLKYTTISL